MNIDAFRIAILIAFNFTYFESGILELTEYLTESKFAILIRHE